MHTYSCTFCGIFQFNNDSPQHEKYFPDNAFDILYRSEEQNFWFRVRNIIIGDAITRYLPKQSRILDVGCGTGYVSRYLKKLGYRVDCTDFFLQALQFCREREAGERYYKTNLSTRLFVEEFDGVCAFDVLEHIDDDTAVLKNVHAALKPGGALFITVPADKHLWSAMDIYAEHKRRYSLRELQAKLEDNGFKVLKMSYFMTFLFPCILISRKISFRDLEITKEGLKNQIEREAMNELQPNKILNSLFYLIFMLEVPLLRSFTFPFGSSLLCVALKEQ
jgi:SAM-dependent methyltransferase